MSTEVNNFLENEKGLPSELFYNLKKSMYSSRAYRINVPCFNTSTQGPSTLCQFLIPARRNCFVLTSKSSIKGTFKNLSTNATANAENYTYDGSAYSLINKLEVFHGSNNLESITQYNVLTAAIMDLQLNASQREGLSSSFGTSYNTDLSGEDRQGLTIPNQSTQNMHSFQLPLLSSIAGCLNPKYLNLNMSDDLRYEITTASATEGVVLFGTATAGWTILNMQLVLDIIELSDSAMELFNSMHPKEMPQITCTNQYRHFVTPQITAAFVGNYSNIIGAKFASLKCIIHCPRSSLTTSTNAATSYSTTCRICPNYAQVNYKIGPFIVPQKPINLEIGYDIGYAEIFTETIKAYHLFSDLNISSSLSSNYYAMCDNTTNLTQTTMITAAVTTAANTYQDSFLYAQDFSTVANKDSVILSGIDTRNSQLYFECQINRAVTYSYTMDFYAMYDALLILDPFGFYTIRF